jgi:hypothetical protein
MVVYRLRLRVVARRSVWSRRDQLGYSKGERPA